MGKTTFLKFVSSAAAAIALSFLFPAASGASREDNEYKINEEALKEVLSSHSVSLSRLTREAERNIRRVNKKLEERDSSCE